MVDRWRLVCDIFFGGMRNKDVRSKFQGYRLKLLDP